jgi:hypothetical protein
MEFVQEAGERHLIGAGNRRGDVLEQNIEAGISEHARAGEIDHLVRRGERSHRAEEVTIDDREAEVLAVPNRRSVGDQRIEPLEISGVPPSDRADRQPMP